MSSLSPSTEVDTEKLVNKLTLEEKISLLAAKDWWRTPIIDRDDLFIPHIKSTDGPNGARGESYVSGIKAACFPCATNLGATFDSEILYQTGQEIAKEACTKSANILLAPTLNVIRSPLGGRNYETYSEDPIVLGNLAAAFVNGCQAEGVAATPKHFVANDAENERKTLSVEIDEQTLREIYLYPFQLVLKLSDPLCFMTSYNKVNGVYVADDGRLINDVLRKEWGFSGLVMSDWMGTYSTVDGINAGLDLEMPGPTRFRGKKLLEAVAEGSVAEETVHKSAERVLELAKKLGRFTAARGELPERAVDNKKRDEFITVSAAEGMVLLKNDDQLLPLPKGRKLAVIGHHAKVVSLGGGGSARVDSLHAVTPLQGLDHMEIPYTYSPGVPVFGALPHADPSIVSRIAEGSHVNSNGKAHETCPVKLEWFNGHTVDESLAHEEMIPNAEYMIKEAWPKYLNPEYCTRMAFNVTPKTTGSHILAVISTGPAKCYIDDQEVFDRPQEQQLKLESFYFFKSKLERRFKYTMEAGRTYKLTMVARNTDLDILHAAPLFGKMFQGASLRFFEHIDIPQAIENAAQTAADAEYAVICVGTTNEVESEGYDRDTMDLPGAQYELIKAVAAANPNTIVVNFSGAPVTMDCATEVPAIVQAWFPGQECGHSVARILTGMINPSGHLPMSWPKRLEDNPSHGNFPAENNIIRYAEGLDIGYRFYDHKKSPDPLFPFGYGLSYTSFGISDVSALASRVAPVGPDGTISISCRVKNTGFRQGKVALQYYVEMPDTSIGHVRPIRELKAFQKVDLAPGEEKTATAKLDKYSFSVYDAVNTCWQGVKGEYTVFVGISSRNLLGSVKFTIAESFIWRGI